MPVKKPIVVETTAKVLNTARPNSTSAALLRNLVRCARMCVRVSACIGSAAFVLGRSTSLPGIVPH
jgi:hypothetical protein